MRPSGVDGRAGTVAPWTAELCTGTLVPRSVDALKSELAVLTSERARAPPDGVVLCSNFGDSAGAASGPATANISELGEVSNG